MAQSAAMPSPCRSHLAICRWSWGPGSWLQETGGPRAGVGLLVDWGRVLGLWWESPHGNRLGGELQNDTCYTSVLVAGQAPKNGCHEHLCPQGETQSPPASLVSTPRSAGGSDPWILSIQALHQDSEFARFYRRPFQKKHLFPTALQLSLCKLHWPSEPEVLGACLPRAGPPRLQSPVWGSDGSLLEETLCSCQDPPVACHLPGAGSLGCATAHAPHLSGVIASLYL